MRLARVGKYYYLRFCRLQGDPKSLAVGTAIGVFVGLTPTLPLHTIILLGLTRITRTSFIAALASSWLVSNPLTLFPIYFFSSVIGKAIFPHALNGEEISMVLDLFKSRHGPVECLQELADLGMEALLVMVAGGCTMVAPVAVVGYFLALALFVRIRKKRRDSNPPPLGLSPPKNGPTSF